MNSNLLILSIPALPLLAAMVIGLLGPRVLRGQSHWPAILGVGGSLAAAAHLLYHGAAAPPGGAAGTVTGTLYTWFAAGGLTARVGYCYDALAAIMLVTVTAVSLLVVVYSRDYMRGHRGYSRFFAYISLFVFAMCTLVLADNFLVLFLGWEGVGLCSYLLIGFYYDQPAAAAAAKKAFIVTRTGDFGFTLGVLATFVAFGSVDFGRVLDPGRIAAVPSGWLIAITLLLLCGAAGKSAQLLLHVWLPDAMEGPSPVSALIHAATMVTAGVYLVARTMPLFAAAPGVLAFVAVLGAATALFAATIALVHTDLKRVLAYSTISQIGYMFLGLGAAAGSAAIFHLFTHAFFKALLFLAAGAVMHAMAGVLDIRRMGGLARSLPVTAGTFLCGGLALSGVPLTAGFFSKDEIIGGVFASTALGPLGPALGWIAILTAGLTGFYTFRLFMRVFTGPVLLPEEAGGHVHRPGAWMLAVQVVLAAAALTAGYAGERLHERLAPLLGRVAGHPEWVPVVSGVVAVGGVLLAVLLYGPLRAWTAGLRIGETVGYKLLVNKYYFDEIYDTLIVRPMHWLGRCMVNVDDYGIDRALAGITWVPRSVGWALRTAQRGSLGGYALAFAGGAVLMTIGMLAAWWLR